MLSTGGSLFSLAVVTRALALPETQLYAHKRQCFLLRGESCTCTHLYIVLQADHGCVCVCVCLCRGRRVFWAFISRDRSSLVVAHVKVALCWQQVHVAEVGLVFFEWQTIKSNILAGADFL